MNIRLINMENLTLRTMYFLPENNKYLSEKIRRAVFVSLVFIRLTLYSPRHT